MLEKMKKGDPKLIWVIPEGPPNSYYHLSEENVGGRGVIRPAETSKGNKSYLPERKTESQFIRSKRGERPG